jgi:GPH family glycoside/pentoside/hexuronide:cation symporter
MALTAVLTVVYLWIPISQLWLLFLLQALIGLMGLTAVFTIVYLWIPVTELWLLFLLQALIGLIMGPLSPLLWSMYTDIADYSEWKYNRRATGLVMSASTMSQKLGWTIGGSIAGWLLAYFGFQANEVQTAESMQGITYMISLLPAIMAVACIAFMSFYLLDAKMIERIELELAERKGEELVEE